MSIARKGRISLLMNKRVAVDGPYSIDGERAGLLLHETREIRAMVANKPVRDDTILQRGGTYQIETSAVQGRQRVLFLSPHPTLYEIGMVSCIPIMDTEGELAPVVITVRPHVDFDVATLDYIIHIYLEDNA